MGVRDPCPWSGHRRVGDDAAEVAAGSSSHRWGRRLKGRSYPQIDPG
jgi:hypothetical protein